MQLIVGLGNIGAKYNYTRHNFGFMLLDQLLNDYNFLPAVKKFDGEIAKGKIDDVECLALKPHSFMNLSGIPVQKVLTFYKIKPQDILVLHDDIDVDFGRIKFKMGGGDGGHNGLKSIDSAIGKNYRRLRLGVGRSQNQNMDSADHVLAKFSSKELLEIDDNINKKISNLFKLLINGESEEFLNRFYL